MEDVPIGERRDGYQSRGHAWSPFRPDIVDVLSRARHASLEPIYYGSNHCFLVTLESAGEGESLAVYKPARGEYPLYDFPSGTLFQREVGSWWVSSVLGWNLVPPTVVTRGKYGPGSLQLFIESVSEGEIEVVELQRLALLDVILNNADRKSDHLLVADESKLWAIDHGLTFNVQPKLRTVLWHFAGAPIAAGESDDLRKLCHQLKSGNGDEIAQIRKLISRSEFQALLTRVERLLDGGVFPNPRYKPVPYRW